MAALSKKKIIVAVAAEFDVKPEYIGLDKFEGEYYWIGKLPALFTGTCIYINNLSQWPLSRWIEDFKFKLKESELSGDLNAKVEAINWEVE